VWDRDRAALEALSPGGTWYRVEPRPVLEEPFFILDQPPMKQTNKQNKQKKKQK
jgi:hypothetical protein